MASFRRPTLHPGRAHARPAAVPLSALPLKRLCRHHAPTGRIRPDKPVPHPHPGHPRVFTPRPDPAGITRDIGVGVDTAIGRNILEDRVLRTGEVIPLRRHARAVDPMVTRLHADRHPVGDGLTLLNDVRGLGGDGGGEAWRGGLVLVQNDHHDGLVHVPDMHDGVIPLVDVVVGVPCHDLLHGHVGIIVESSVDVIWLRACVVILVGLDVGVPCGLPLVLAAQFSMVGVVERGAIVLVAARDEHGTDRDHTAVAIALTGMTPVEAAHALGVGGVERCLHLGRTNRTTNVLAADGRASRVKCPLNGLIIGRPTERTRRHITRVGKRPVPVLPEHMRNAAATDPTTGILASAATASIGRGSNDAARGKGRHSRKQGNTLPQPFRLALGRSLRIMLLQLHNAP